MKRKYKNLLFAIGIVICILLLLFTVYFSALNKDSVIFYLLISFISVCIALSLLYLYLSDFNKFGFDKTFTSLGKIISYFCAALVLATAITLSLVMLISRIKI